MKPGWQIRPLGEVCSFQRGLTYSKGDEAESGTAVLRATNIDLETGGLDLSEIRFIRPKVAVPSSKMVRPGTLLICTASGSKRHLGKTAIIDRAMEYAFGGFMGLLQPSNTVVLKYLQWLMRSDSYWKFIDALSDGANINNLKFSQLSEFPVPLPPLEEQRRIVAILDEAFEGLDRARANAEANLASARELFEKSLVLSLGGHSSTRGASKAHEWPERELREVVSFHNGDRGKNYPNKSEYVANGVPWLNTGQILPNGSLSASKMNFISPAKFKTLGGGRIQPGDLVFCLRGATIGKTAFVAPYDNGAVASSLMIIRPTPAISDRYAYYFLTSELGKNEIGRFIGGAAQPNLAGESVGRFRLRLPPREVQSDIVDRLDKMKSSLEVMQGTYQANLQAIADLRQSLLQKAFAGELT